MTEVGLKIKSSPNEKFNLRLHANGTYTATNSLANLWTVLGVGGPLNPSLGGTWNIQIDHDSSIKFHGWTGGISVQVIGKGDIFSGSEGMFGSWDYGGVRFKDGTLFDTTLGYASPGAIALAQDWQVTVDSLMFAPSAVCDASPSCGPTEAFQCTDVRRALEVSDSRDGSRRLDSSCGKTDCNHISVDFLKEACEKDIDLTGDISFACEPSKLIPLIVEPGPNDFVPHPNYPVGTSDGGGGEFYLCVINTTRCLLCENS